MARLLIFDTETTGLPRIRIPSNMEPNNWPHIVSISWAILNAETNKVEKQRSYIIKPRNWVIPDDSIKIHGITNERAMNEGYPLEKVIGEFLAEQYEILVAHNLEFDINVLYNAIQWDLELPFKTLNKKSLCTMELSKDLCKLPGNFGKYKSPKLSELYEHTFRRKPLAHALHNSSYDVLILTEIIQHCNGLRLKMNLPILSVNKVEDEIKKNSETVLYLN